ncbi:protein anachronism isoform X3 [Musca domestica]|nr:protein anachronism isoform X3 [Musca domestica]
MAAYPTCNSEKTEASWLNDNNITIQFSSTLFEQKMQNLNLDSAILRLFKINPNDTRDNQELASGVSNNGDNDGDDDVSDDTTKLKRCAEPTLDAQIRVTVSIVQQTRRNKRGVYERKKRICNTIMMNVSTTGWVEIDIRRAIYIWENVGKQMEQNQQSRPPVLVGYLMIEVHDEEEQPLKPGLFFKPPSCNQADLAIPWNYYRPYSPSSPFATLEVPRYPRLDVKLIGYASFAPINQPEAQPDTVYASLKDKLFNLTHKTSSSEADSESTTQISSAANNHLQEVSSDPEDEEEHLHHKRHLKGQQLKETIEDVEEQEEENGETETVEDDNEQIEDSEAEEVMPAETVEYNYRNHPRHRRHHHREHHEKLGQQHYRRNHEKQEHRPLRDNNEKTIFEDSVTPHNDYDNVHHPHRRHRFSTEQSADPVELTIEAEQHETKLLQHIVHKLQQEQKQLLLLHQQQEQTPTYAI